VRGGVQGGVGVSLVSTYRVHKGSRELGAGSGLLGSVQRIADSKGGALRAYPGSQGREPFDELRPGSGPAGRSARGELVGGGGDTDAA
jgi:hypothetical protein